VSAQCIVWKVQVTSEKKVQQFLIWLNTYKQLSVAVPYGGFKESGQGQKKGFYGIRTCQEPKTMMVDLS
jgi:betaine-aldehyde dehydrogenase